MNKDNIITVAVWAGESKPLMTTFFEPLISLFTSLSTDGIKLKTPVGQVTTMKFSPLFGTFDLVAKAPILNMHQFNGKQHVSIQENGLALATILPDKEYATRTNDSVKRAAQKAEEQRTVMDGVKGRSALTDVVDLVDDIPVDYMHCVLEGGWLRNGLIPQTIKILTTLAGTSIKLTLICCTSPPLMISVEHHKVSTNTVNIGKPVNLGIFSFIILYPFLYQYFRPSTFTTTVFLFVQCTFFFNLN